MLIMRSCKECGCNTFVNKERVCGLCSVILDKDISKEKNNEKSSIINYFHITKPKQGKFIALFTDGSGAGLFTLCDSGEIMSAEGEIDYDNIEDMMGNYSAWISLENENFKYWHEDNHDSRT